jgi:acyl carrier protein
MQMMGGRGYIESNAIAQVFRDARVFRIFEGPTEALHHFLGASATRTPHVLRTYLATLMDEAALREYFDAPLEQLQSSAAGSHADLAHWRYSAAGCYVCELVFYAIGRAANTVPNEWLNERLIGSLRAFETAMQRAPTIESADALTAFARVLDEQLGEDTCRVSQPELKRDPWIGPAASADTTQLGSPNEPVGIAAPVPLPIALTPAPRPCEAPDAAGKFNEIAGFITQWIAKQCGIEPAAVGLDAEFALLGLGSIDSTTLADSVSERFLVDLDPTVLWNYPNTRELATFVDSKLKLFDCA